MTIDTVDIVVNLSDKHCELIMLDCYVRKCLVWKINGSNINKLVAAMDTITLVKELSKVLQNTVQWVTLALGRRFYELTS